MARRKGDPIHGWLVFDKPQGMTSTQAVSRVRHLYGAQKAGHAGTLDPLATGVLPIAFGEATKTVPFAVDGDKQYRFIPEVAKVTVPPSWPGPTTAASQQVWDLYIIPDMFAQYATGKMSLDQAVAWGEKEMQEIYAGRKRRP